MACCCINIADWSLLNIAVMIMSGVSGRCRIPENSRQWSNAGSISAQRLRRWAIIELALDDAFLLDHRPISVLQYAGLMMRRGQRIGWAHHRNDHVIFFGDLWYNYCDKRVQLGGVDRTGNSRIPLIFHIKDYALCHRGLNKHYEKSDSHRYCKLR